MQETSVRFLGREDPLEKGKATCSRFLGLPVSYWAKNLPAIQETWVLILGWEDSPGEGHSNPFQYSYLENPMGTEA